MPKPCLACEQVAERCACPIEAGAERSGGWASAAQRYRVLARDRWLCPVCDSYINPRMRPPEPGSACIERLRPLGRAGADPDSNLRAIHRACRSPSR